MAESGIITLSFPEPDIAVLALDDPNKGANVLSAAVLAELESEVRIAVSAARAALLPAAEVHADLDRVARVTLPPSSAASASRLMNGWAMLAFERAARRSASEADELRS